MRLNPGRLILKVAHWQGWSRYQAAALHSAMLLAVLLTVRWAAPQLETQFWPVTTHFEIIEATAMPDGRTRVVFEYTKLRQCSPIGAGWYYRPADGGNIRLLEMVRADGTQQLAPRPIGTQESVPFVVNASLDQLLNSTFAEVYHNCWSWWPTRTIIYP